ncbi:MAG: ABC transporter permease [Ruminococcus sp.]|nr:ABC transporter permease [Ruminococcus sp.]
MFLHNLKYELLAGFRAKELVIWLLIFPIALAVLFKVAFGDIYEKYEVFSSIPAAVVDIDRNPSLKSVLDGMESSGEPLMKVTYTDEEGAKELLKKDDVEGIIYAGADQLTLTVSGQGMSETLLKTFCDQYNKNAKIITDTAKKDPSKIAAVTSILMKETNAVKDAKLVRGNSNYYDEYFYNLIAMVALFGALIGLTVAVDNQANLSPLGARKNCSPTPKSLSLAASLISRFVLQTLCMTISVTFECFVLKIDFGDRLGLVYLAAILAGILGVSIGFAVGSIGTMEAKLKQTILTSVLMIFCFLSGLMDAGMKQRIAENVPFINRINPAAVITDSFHALNVYSDTKVYTEKIITMLIMTAVFSMLGFILTRRRKYASL